VFKTLQKYEMISRDDMICVAASGGKDSQTVLYLVRKYLLRNNLPTEKLFALCIDEGIKDYRDKTIKNLKQFCSTEEIRLEVISAKKEFSLTLDQAAKKAQKVNGKKPCNVCGVWRRYLLNKYARKLGATKVVTGHNLDDEAQVVVMNIFKANTSLAAGLGPVSGVYDHELFVRRIKPLYLCPEKETRLYSRWILRNVLMRSKGIGYRSEICSMILKASIKGRSKV